MAPIPDGTKQRLEPPLSRLTVCVAVGYDIKNLFLEPTQILHESNFQYQHFKSEQTIHKLQKKAGGRGDCLCKLMNLAFNQLELEVFPNKVEI